jgi:signal peptidase
MSVYEGNLVADDSKGREMTDPAGPTTPTVGVPQFTITEVPSRFGAKALPVRIATWLVMAVVTVVVLALLGVTIGPRVFHYQALVVRSGSMSPTIPTGSIVFYTKIPADKVKVGDVIVFSRPDNPAERVTHRVYKIGKSSTGRYFETKGDANGAPDDWRVPAVGEGWLARWHIPVAGYVLYDLQSTAARLLLLVVPALLLGTITLGELWRDRKRRETPV